MQRVESCGLSCKYMTYVSCMCFTHTRINREFLDGQRVVMGSCGGRSTGVVTEDGACWIMGAVMWVRCVCGAVCCRVMHCVTVAMENGAC